MQSDCFVMLYMSAFCTSFRSRSLPSLPLSPHLPNVRLPVIKLHSDWAGLQLLPSQELMDKHLPPELDSPTARRLDVLFQQHKYYGDEDAVHAHQMPHALHMPHSMFPQ